MAEIKNINVKDVDITVKKGDDEPKVLNLISKFAFLDLNDVTETNLSIKSATIKIGDKPYTFTNDGSGDTKCSITLVITRGEKTYTIKGVNLSSVSDIESAGEAEITEIILENVGDKTPTIVFSKDKESEGGGRYVTHKKQGGKKTRKARKGGRRQTKYARRNKK